MQEKIRQHLQVLQDKGYLASYYTVFSLLGYRFLETRTNTHKCVSIDRD
ncbi:MAG: hypothetical protein HEQ32_05790 [Vampirovibrio sp.]